jgi:hypothetical protein
MTSIEWLIEALENPHKNINWEDTKQQAKEMHKKEIIDAHLDGQSLVSCKDEYAEQYYQETFVSKGSETKNNNI